MKHLRLLTLISILLFSASIITMYADSTADARSRGGGRSFGSSRSFRTTRPATPPPIRQPARTSTRSTRTGSGGSSFMRGLGGGLLGGFLGSMLFGSLAHAGGGIGGSGIGLFQILIIGGIGYFLYKKFVKKNDSSRGQGLNSNPQGGYSPPPPGPTGSTPPPPPGGAGSTIDAPPPGGGTLYESTPQQQSAPPSFNEDEIKELAQDIFFKVQAAWMRRDISAIQDILGPELLAQYQADFQDMKARGIVNRLENIAVRSVEIIEAGREDGFEYVKVKFTANLLDYTVEESTGRVIEGSDQEPVKFQEVWTLARPEGTEQWKLYAIE